MLNNVKKSVLNRYPIVGLQNFLQKGGEEYEKVEGKKYVCFGWADVTWQQSASLR